jgi:hypothetical protein
VVKKLEFAWFNKLFYLAFIEKGAYMSDPADPYASSILNMDEIMFRSPGLVD